MIDRFSFTSLMIEMLFEDEKLSTATGFIIRKGNLLYLVTNKHNVTGVDNNTKKPIDTGAAKPNFIRIWFCVNRENLIWQSKKYPLYLTSEIWTESKRWLEHHEDKIDVILLPLDSDELLAMNTFDLDTENFDMLAAPAMPVSIIGFPLAQTGGKKLPVWVTGFIASEPDINIEDPATGKELPVFYINSLGKSGLSGSPVIIRTFGNYNKKNYDYEVVGGLQERFMGIYSGRLLLKREDTQSDICKVWKPIVINQILSNNFL